MRSITSWTVLLGIAAATASCGGGGGSGADPATPAIADTSIPIVSAGADTAVAPSQMAAARIFRAAPPDTSVLFDWAEAHFPTLFPSHQANQTFATYVYRFYPETGNYVGVDGGVFARVLGPSFGPDIVTVGVVSDFTCDVTPQVCASPIASTSAQLSVDVGTVAALDGSTSSDPGGSPLAYAWTLVAKPAGSAAELTGAATAQPSLMPDMVGIYQVQLVVSNGTAASAPATVVVTALATSLPPGYILY